MKSPITALRFPHFMRFSQLEPYSRATCPVFQGIGKADTLRTSGEVVISALVFYTHAGARTKLETKSMPESALLHKQKARALLV